MAASLCKHTFAPPSLLSYLPFTLFLPVIPTYSTGSNIFLHLSYASFVVLWLSAGLAVWSLSIYMANVWQHFLYPPTPPASKKSS